VKRTILLADDSPTIQRLVTQTFADVDFKIVSVSNGEAAVRKFDEIRPDIVLADIYMPGRNGFEVCSHVRNRADFGTIPVVLLVGAFDAFDETTAARAGATAHITKPFEPQALVNLVVSLLAPGGEAGERSDEPVAEFEAPQPVADVPQPVAEAPQPVAEAPSPTPVAVVPDPTPPIETSANAEEGDLMGLQELFKPPAPPPVPPVSVSDAEIDRIAERVLQKLSTQVIEDVAWDVVPDITSKILRDELKRNS
jgi:CheY-like chemotaxis protein